MKKCALTKVKRTTICAYSNMSDTTIATIQESAASTYSAQIEIGDHRIKVDEPISAGGEDLGRHLLIY